ncbi:MAG: DUF1269 domain-containing protein [Lachnospiraceae bacterium]|nr:DUF1269 domain-containing protein [Lachnospiraceae bacterium]
MQNVIIGLFEVESEGFQAITELKQNPGDEKSFISQAALLKKDAGQVKVLDSFDTGVTTSDDMALGGLMGMCVGILGGPIGMLLGGSLGSLTGMTVDAADAIDNASMIEQIAGKLEDGAVALIGLTDEEDEGVLDEKLSKYKTVIARFDAAVVAQEVDAAREMQAEMERQALEKLRKQKTDEFKSKVEAHRDKMKAHFEELKAKFK